MKFEDLAPFLTFQAVGDIRWNTFKVEGTLRLQAVLICIQASRPVELFHIYEIGTRLKRLFSFGLDV